jgi:hypothetical protein
VNIIILSLEALLFFKFVNRKTKKGLQNLVSLFFVLIPGYLAV